MRLYSTRYYVSEILIVNNDIIILKTKFNSIDNKSPMKLAKHR